MALGGDGRVYVAGATEAADFPTTAGAYDRQPRWLFRRLRGRARPGRRRRRPTRLRHLPRRRRPRLRFRPGAGRRRPGLSRRLHRRCLPDFPTTPGAYDTQAHWRSPTPSWPCSTRPPRAPPSSPTPPSSAAVGPEQVPWRWAAPAGSTSPAPPPLPDFPTTPGAYDRSHNGSLRRLRGRARPGRRRRRRARLRHLPRRRRAPTRCRHLALGDDGWVYLAGYHLSPPTSRPPPAPTTGPQRRCEDAFVAKLGAPAPPGAREPRSDARRRGAPTANSAAPRPPPTSAALSAEGYTGARLRRVPDDPEPERRRRQPSTSPTTSPAAGAGRSRRSPCRPTAAPPSPSTTRPQGVGRGQDGQRQGREHQRRRHRRRAADVLHLRRRTRQRHRRPQRPWAPPRPRQSWLFAEGYTGAGFDEYLTILNPNPQPPPRSTHHLLPRRRPGPGRQDA